MKNKEQVVINSIIYEYSDYYKRLETTEKEDEKQNHKAQIACPKCHATEFSISYGEYKCIANCKCGHSMTVYDE